MTQPEDAPAGASPEAGDGAPPAPFALAVVGLGCIGGSIALRARNLGVRVVGFDLPEALDLALSLGLIDEALPSLEAATSAAVLVLATPPAVTRDYLERLTAYPVKNAVVMDVASVKVPVALAGANLPNFVPTHPIAGSERSGPGAASESLFDGRTWAIVPQGQSEARARTAAFVNAMGGRPLTVDAAAHDRAVAVTSHLPQVVSVALAAGVGPTLEDPVALALAGPGLASMIRLGGSSWEMWRDILSSNRISVAQDLRGLAQMLGDIAARLEQNDIGALEATFASAAAATRRLNGSANARAADAVAGALPS